MWMMADKFYNKKLKNFWLQLLVFLPPPPPPQLISLYLNAFLHSVTCFHVLIVAFVFLVGLLFYFFMHMIVPSMGTMLRKFARFQH
jgi:hypothetical protein